MLVIIQWKNSMLQIFSHIDTDLVNYPGRCCTTFFFSVCPMRCKYCYTLAKLQQKNYGMSEEEYEKILQRAANNWIEAIAYTGGEPLACFDNLQYAIDKAEQYGMKYLKLDTNGAYPKELLQVLPRFSYIAMDVKTVIEDYPNLTGYQKKENILESIEILKSCPIDHEYRITVIEEYHTREQLEEMAKLLDGQKVVLQRFRPEQSFAMRDYKETSSLYIENIAKDIFPGAICR